jgi:hypothetical protein
MNKRSLAKSPFDLQQGDNMNNDKGAIPVFATVVSVLMILIGLFFAYSLYTNPGALMKEVDFSNAAVGRMAFALATRSLTMAIALLLALALKSRLGLIAVLSMRFVTEALDLVNSLSAGQQDSLVVISVMLLAELVAIILLWRSLQTSKT